MMDRTSPVRKHTRFPVRWPVLYGSEDFVSAGTVLDLTQTGWRMAGAMPVQPGMHLTLQLWPINEAVQNIQVTRATVLWVKGCEFAIEVPGLAQHDRNWIIRFLTQKLGLSWTSQTPSRRSLPSTHLDITQAQEASIQRDLVRQVGIGTDYRLTIARVRRESKRLIHGIQARRLRAQAGQNSIDHN
jgi:hypothetical protein